MFCAGRTLEEARQLVEKSFGNYVGSNVMLAAQEEYQKIQEEIEQLTFETSAEAIDRKCREQLPEMAHKEIFEMQEELRVYPNCFFVRGVFHLKAGNDYHMMDHKSARSFSSLCSKHKKGSVKWGNSINIG